MTKLRCATPWIPGLRWGLAVVVAATLAACGGDTTWVTSPASVTPASIGTVTKITGVKTFDKGTAVASGASTTEDSRLKLSGTVSEALKTGQVVQVYQGGTLLGNATVSGTGWTYDIEQPITNARHSFTARVRDTGTSTDGPASSAYSVTVNVRYSLVANMVNGGVYSKEECVEDRANRLIWEGKVPGSGFRGSDEVFTNYDSTYDGGTNINAITNSAGHMNKVNTQALCGFSALWRMPTIDELKSLLEGSVAPRIDTNWFPNTKAGSSDRYATSSLVVGANNVALYVRFNNGTISNDYRSNTFAVRLVRVSQ